nr:splicing factor U2af large subunit B-like isoform X2 [Tanacetum cinerariifolium]
MSAIGGNTAGPGDVVVNVHINHEKKFAFVETRSLSNTFKNSWVSSYASTMEEPSGKGNQFGFHNNKMPTTRPADALDQWANEYLRKADAYGWRAEAWFNSLKN